jgi:hypothetical protein
MEVPIGNSTLAAVRIPPPPPPPVLTDPLPLLPPPATTRYSTNNLLAKSLGFTIDLLLITCVVTVAILADSIPILTYLRPK